MKYLLQLGLLAAYLLFAAGGVRAQTVVCKGPQDACARASDAVRLFVALHARDLGAVADGWRFVLLDADGWARITETFREQVHLEKITGSAFTVAAIRTTYINLAWFSAQFPSRQLETVTHELAHIAGCGREEACARAETRRRLEMLGAMK